MARTPVIQGPQPNDDERTFGSASTTPYIGNFHKTLRHDANGEVDPAQYAAFVEAALHGDFESVPAGPFSAPATSTARLVDPQCSRADDFDGPDPLRMEMQPAPGVLSLSTAAEMTELLWMAALRDQPFDSWTPALLALPLAELQAAFGAAAADTADRGRLRMGIDLPFNGTALNLTPGTLFRMGLQRERRGPLVSQFLLQDFNYGAQLVSQTVYPYKAQANYLTDLAAWKVAQDSGRDASGNDYAGDNNFTTDAAAYDVPPVRVRMRNMRDLARFVNRDALHQAYFNAALQLLNWGESAVPFNDGNPYKSIYKRQAPFGTLGGPNLLALVSEVATRALKVVWRQKWIVHRRLRPEAYGGLMEMQHNGSRAYGLPATAIDSAAWPMLHALPGAANTRLLPLAYTAGSPAHPSYGAGHACVAGACVTVLKAWFKDTNLLDAMKAAAMKPKDPGPPPLIRQPGAAVDVDGDLPEYFGPDKTEMTVHGELNKLAANIAMGRTMGGVHWRSDNTRSLRLGERVATIFLARHLRNLAERPLKLSYYNFDRDRVVIEGGGAIKVPDDPELQTFYSRF